MDGHLNIFVYNISSKPRLQKGDSGCGSVGRAAASNTRDLQFKSNHWQNVNRTLLYCQLYRKDENKEMVHLEIEFKRYQSEHTHSPKAKGRKEYGNKTFNANI